MLFLIQALLNYSTSFDASCLFRCLDTSGISSKCCVFLDPGIKDFLFSLNMVLYFAQEILKVVTDQALVVEVILVFTLTIKECLELLRPFILLFLCPLFSFELFIPDFRQPIRLLRCLCFNFFGCVCIWHCLPFSLVLNIDLSEAPLFLPLLVF